MLAISRISLPLLMMAGLGATAADAQQAIWRGRSGGFDVAWTERDITARRASDGALVFSARRVADAEWAKMASDHDDEVPVREFEMKYRLMSVVGSIVSLEEANYCDCGGAHPILWTRFVAYDLARGTVARPHEVRATDLVPERELLRALMADRLVRQAMDSAHVRSFASLAAMVEALKTHEIQPPGDDCTYGVGEDFAQEFAFHHLEAGRAAMRFSLSHYVEICRGRMIQLGVLVAPNARLLPDLQAADARRAGFLMKDARTIGRNRQTVFNYQPRRR
ncbi:MAG TPA: hypothetical protein VF092_00165 [Longimicrobium sp.]